MNSMSTSNSVKQTYNIGGGPDQLHSTILFLETTDRRVLTKENVATSKGQSGKAYIRFNSQVKTKQEQSKNKYIRVFRKLNMTSETAFYNPNSYQEMFP